MLFTVFTPTFNRAHLLNRVYKSLLKQTFTNFEWLIVDDGSTDNTQEVVQSFLKENKLVIRYVHQQNGGKHRAINTGVAKAKGIYFLILDSDDLLPEQSLSILNTKIESLKNDSIGGVVGRKFFLNNKQIGTAFKNDIISNSLEIRYKHHITGDLAEVFKTAVLKEFPFPDIANEKFCPEALVWNRIAQKYQLLFFNAGMYIAEYLPDGLTHKIVKIRMESPIASMLHYAELTNYKVPLKIKMKSAINFWRFSFNASLKLKEKIAYIKGLYYLALLPLGYLMYLNDKR